MECPPAVALDRIDVGSAFQKRSNKFIVPVVRGSCKGKLTFTVRKISNNVGVERIFPFSSPFIDGIDVNKHGVVRRSRIFYLRELRGKKARIKEKKY